ncbi:hypothetical protein ACFV2X_48020 [Streptomyces sp. NPDC059679]|uniref:hypothetical protein n=1 Tax=Streptomyces sp. NPDC059679 TaxID=3346903 RepID=UPI00368B4296
MTHPETVVGPDGLTLRERAWYNQSERLVMILNTFLKDRGSPVHFAFPARVDAADVEAPERTYTSAQPFTEDIFDILRLSTALLQIAKGNQVVPMADERHLILKRAVLTDRIASATPTTSTAQIVAVQEAQALVRFDTAHSTTCGPITPESPTWESAGGPRGYVRQEYTAWRFASSPSSHNFTVLPDPSEPEPFA